MTPQKPPLSLMLRALLAAGAMLLLGALALLSQYPLLFPAIGASAFLIFRDPRLPGAHPRSVVLGHGVAVVVGLLCLLLFARLGVQGSLVVYEDWNLIASGALALPITFWVCSLLEVSHPPAGATTMIVGLGLLPHPWQALSMWAAALLLCAYSRLLLAPLGIDYPLWQLKPPRRSPATVPMPAPLTELTLTTEREREGHP